MKTLVTLVWLRNLNVVPHPKKLSPSSCCQQSQSDSTWLPTHLDDAEIFIDVIHVWNTVCFFVIYKASWWRGICCQRTFYVITPSGVSLRVMIPRNPTVLLKSPGVKLCVCCVEVEHELEVTLGEVWAFFHMRISCVAMLPPDLCCVWSELALTCWEVDGTSQDAQQAWHVVFVLSVT